MMSLVHKGSAQIISKTEHRILEALARLEWLTPEQTCRLLFSYPGSLQNVRGWLLALYRRELIGRRRLPPGPTDKGTGPLLYALEHKGRAYLASSGIEVKHYFRPSEEFSRSYLFLEHKRRVNDVLITIERLTRTVSHIALADMVFERELQAQPIWVSEGNKRVRVVFDAWVHLIVAAIGARYCIALELDRGSEHQKDFRQKIRRLIASQQGAYEQRFAVDSFILAIVTTAGEGRVQSLLSWIEAELTEAKARPLAHNFCVIHAAFDTATAHRFFLTPCWFQPFTQEPVYILDGITELALPIQHS